MIAKSARLALHMAEASTTELPRTRTRRPMPLVGWWLKGVALLLASTGIVIVTIRLLRWGIT